MNVNIKIHGLEKVHEINKILMDEKNYELVLDEIAKDTLNLARQYAPLAAIHRHAEILEQGGFITSSEKSRIISFDNIPHATYMEYGTMYFPVPDTVDAPMARTSTSGKPCYHPFLRPAAYQISQIIPEYINKIIFSKIK
jgi:hypothetical protein